MKNFSKLKAPAFIVRPWRRFRHASRRKQIAIVGGIIAAFLIITPILTFAYFVRDIKDPERLMNRNSTGFVLLDRSGNEIYTFGRSGKKENIALDKVSDDFEKALLASEDQKFYEHSGVSIRGIVGAFIANILNKDLTKYGGSTITQQLVKNNLLSNRKNVLRKYQEVSIAIAIEREYTKDEILQMYINSVYFGEGAFGIDAAAKTYFDKPASDLSLAESTMLVGLLPAPSAYSPISGDPDLAKQKQERVLDKMVEAGYIEDTDVEAAVKAQLTYAPESAGDEEHAQHFIQMVIAELYDRYGEESVTRGGFKVTTGLDMEWQKQAEAIMAEREQSLLSQGGSNASLVAMDPKTGEIRALVGSIDWTNEKYGKVNMATTPRQPGSSFKPVYYTEAIDKKIITPATIMEDKRKSYGEYSPQNYDFKYRGNITVRNALATSLNIPAVDVMQKLGVEEAIGTAERMGITTLKDAENYGLSLALGTAETKLTEMTNAYAAFANQGVQSSPTMIVSIKNKFDDTIFTQPRSNKRVQSAEASYLISSILSDNQARAPTFGSSLNISGRKVAVKTGTTDDYKDAWTIGYTPSVVTGVWVGNNDHTPMEFGGSTLAGPIWRGSMQKFLENLPKEDFPMPGGVIRTTACNANGSGYNEFFIRGTEGTARCSIRNTDDEAAKKAEEERRKREEEEKKRREEEERQSEEADEDSTETTEPAPVPPPAPEPDPAPSPSPSPAPEPAPGPAPPPPEDDTTTQ